MPSNCIYIASYIQWSQLSVASYQKWKFKCIKNALMTLNNRYFITEMILGELNSHVFFKLNSKQFLGFL